MMEIQGSHQRRASRFRHDEGAAVVEAALALPLLVLLTLGMVTAGLTYNRKLQLSQATREAARYGATIPSTQAWTSGTWQSNVKTMLLARSIGELTAPGSTLCVALVQGSPAVVVSPASSFSSTGAPCDATETYPVTTDDIGRRVQVKATRPSTIETGFWTFNITVQAKATAKSESDQ